MAADEQFDAVVVGSGFGGSVTAYRLAQAGQQVLVLERGRAYPPGSFPRSPLGIKRNIWDPAQGGQGMYDMWSFDGFDGLVCSGLGGGSLIYANVLLRKDERWFVHDDHSGGAYENWPVTRADLDPHYTRAEKMLDAQAYPLEHPPYDTTAKTLAMREAAAALGHEWLLPNLAITFANPGRPPGIGEPILEERPNIHGRPRETCRLCGECDVGCNYGSKNTLDYTYLTAAHYAGAEIRTRCQVREFHPLDDGRWSVSYVTFSDADDGVKLDLSQMPRTTVIARRLILSAGTFGTTHLLLANRASLPGLSSSLGEGFSGNGDLLTFAQRVTQEGPDGRRVPRDLEPGRGPVITCAMRVGDALDGDGSSGRGFYLEDAGYPQFVSWVVQALSEPGAVLRETGPLLVRAAERLLHHNPENLGDEVSELLGDCLLSAGLLPLLGMGRDVPDGRMHLDGDDLQIDWSRDGRSRAFFDRLNDVSREVAHKLGGDFMDNPIWFLRRVITVHPLGGTRMGIDDAHGVVDPWGRVFNHPGLHVADGSVMPGPVGANPSLTIAALADRFADAIIEGRPEPGRERPASIAAMPSSPVSQAPGESPDGPSGAASVRFTEEMKGYCAFGAEDFDAGYRAGREAGNSLMFHLTISTGDIERFIAEAQHEGVAEGWIGGSAFGERLTVSGGQFNLFVDVATRHKRMWYRLPFADRNGRALTLVVYKEVRDDGGLDMWTDTTTLFTRVLEGHVAGGAEDQAAVVAVGILHIHPLDFARQLTTFRVEPAAHVGALARFGKLFAGDLWDVYRPK